MAGQVQFSSQHRSTREKAAAKVKVAWLCNAAHEQKMRKHQIKDLNQQHQLSCLERGVALIKECSPNLLWNRQQQRQQATSEWSPNSMMSAIAQSCNHV